MNNIRVLFINPPFKKGYSRSSRSPAVTKSGTLYYPIFLSYTAALLESRGFKVKLLDAVANNLDYHNITGFIRNFTPSIVVTDVSIHSSQNDLAFVNKIKSDFPDILTGIVGTFPAIKINRDFNEYSFDFAVSGEYDEIILYIADKLKNNQVINKVNKLYVNSNSVKFDNTKEIKRLDYISLDNYPFISEFYNKHLYIKKYFYSASLYPVISIITARGCPFNCSFCLMPRKFFNKVRMRTVKNAADEFRYVTQNMPSVKEIFIEDDTFNINNRRVEEFSKILISQDNKISWSVNVRPDIDEANLKLMKQAGCRLLVIGIETANNRTLANIKKDISYKKIVEFIKLTKKYSLLVHACYILGMPGETENDFIKTLNLSIKLNTDTVQFFPVMIYKGTEMYRQEVENSRSIEFNENYITSEGMHSCNIEREKLSGRKINELCSLFRKKYYLRLKYILYKLRQVLTSYYEFKRTLRSLKVFYKHLF